MFQIFHQGGTVALLRRIKPADEFSIRIRSADRRSHERSELLINFRRIAPGTTGTTAARSAREHMADASPVIFTEHDVDHAAQSGNGGEEPVERLRHVISPRDRRSTEETRVTATPAEQLRMLFRFRPRNGKRDIAEHLRFTEKNVDLDPVPSTAPHSPAKFFKPDPGVPAVFRKYAGGNVLKIHGKPKTVHAFMRQLVQVFPGIIVDVVRQFIDEKRRPIGRPEKTAGNAVFHKGPAFPFARGKGGAFRLADPIFQKIDSATHSGGIRRFHHTRLRSGGNEVLLRQQRTVLLKSNRIGPRPLRNPFRLQYTPQREKCGFKLLFRRRIFHPQFRAVSHALPGHAGRTSRPLREKIDRRTSEIIDECHEKARSIIKEHKNELVKIAEALIEYETLTSEQIERLINGESITEASKKNDDENNEVEVETDQL